MADDARAGTDLDRLILELRPALHRYCARMVGSAFEGEDVVQDALAKAAEAWSSAGVLERPQSWLFRIAHNTALDALRHRRRQAALEARASAALDNPAVADARVAATSSFATLMALTPAQRSCVVLVDVLGHSLDEACDVLGVTAPAAKAALHRGRLRLRELAAVEGPAPALDPQMLRRLRDYADRFNARDFDALRALLAEDVRLDLVNRTHLAGRKDVGVYFTRYGEAAFSWLMSVGVADGRPAILVRDPLDPPGTARWVVLLNWNNGQIAVIRDFLYADYVMESVTVAAL
ncbi:MAG: sigma-70 family RNA polymerase sigma factor [Pseudomonadota bacterium]|nr:sigma-70 family RNA polymerase sigma factor [Pseudomonadota bacterium]